MATQNYANHRRVVPMFHGVLFFLLVLTLIGSCVNLYMSMGDHQRLYSAALEERRDHVYQAVMMDPNAGATLTTSQIEAMVDELLEAHGELMPAGLRARSRRRPAWRAPRIVADST